MLHTLLICSKSVRITEDNAASRKVANSQQIMRDQRTMWLICHTAFTYVKFPAEYTSHTVTNLGQDFHEMVAPRYFTMSVYFFHNYR